MTLQVRSATAAGDGSAGNASQSKVQSQCCTQHPAGILHDTRGARSCITQGSGATRRHAGDSKVQHLPRTAKTWRKRRAFPLAINFNCSLQPPPSLTCRTSRRLHIPSPGYLLKPNHRATMVRGAPLHWKRLNCDACCRMHPSFVADFSEWSWLCSTAPWWTQGSVSLRGNVVAGAKSADTCVRTVLGCRGSKPSSSSGKGSGAAANNLNAPGNNPALVYSVDGSGLKLCVRRSAVQCSAAGAPCLRPLTLPLSQRANVCAGRCSGVHRSCGGLAHCRKGVFLCLQRVMHCSCPAALA